MSRIAKMLINVPSNVSITIDGQIVTIKGSNGELTRIINTAVKIKYENDALTLSLNKGYLNSRVQAGTVYSLLKSMILGVTEGFTKVLNLVGVGYRADVKDNILNLTLGFSHPIKYCLPIGVTAECPSQSEIILKGVDKQIIGQTAANLRSYRCPEPYKGKGIRYVNEVIRIKEAKKK